MNTKTIALLCLFYSIGCHSNPKEIKAIPSPITELKARLIASRVWDDYLNSRQSIIHIENNNIYVNVQPSSWQAINTQGKGWKLKISYPNEAYVEISMDNSGNNIYVEESAGYGP